MTPLFMVVRKDGKTDNVYDADFKKGVFVGGGSKYSYEDIDVFHIPKETISAMFYAPAKKEKQTEE